MEAGGGRSPRGSTVRGQSVLGDLDLPEEEPNRKSHTAGQLLAGRKGSQLGQRTHEEGPKGRGEGSRGRRRARWPSALVSSSWPPRVALVRPSRPPSPRQTLPHDSVSPS